MKDTINELLWDEEEGCWFDFDIINLKLRKEFYASNLIPLWAGAQKSDSAVRRVMQYMEKVGALSYQGGVPTSLTPAGEQWDFPNGWAPLQHLIVEALDRSGNPDAQALAFEISERWIASNYKAFTQSGNMFEKVNCCTCKAFGASSMACKSHDGGFIFQYDVTTIGVPGGGGEYEVVVGFGWTNGVALDFMHRYGDRLHIPVEGGEASSAMRLPNYLTNSIVFGGASVLLASLLG
jgi:alpha,alpha-trehalase